MLLGFWKKIKRPFFAMAPMADVTDAAFRRMFAKYSKKNGEEFVTWTEFVSADGLCLAPKEGREKLLKSFEYTKAERPIVAQIFGSKPEYIEKASRIVADLGFDGVDLNMGCPDKKVEKQKAGAAMMRDPELAKEIILAAKRGAESGKNKIPVSVKTRLGFNKDELETWLPKILEAEPALVIVHARTRKEMSLVPARWERVKRAVEIRDEFYRNDPKNFLSKSQSDKSKDKNFTGQGKTLIAGNGDVASLEDGKKLAKETGADGVMIGRGLFGNPAFFADGITHNSNFKLRLKMMVEHTKLFEKLCTHKNFAVMKKHYKAYCHGFDGAKELRVELMDTQSAKEVETIVKKWLNKAK